MLYITLKIFFCAVNGDSAECDERDTEQEVTVNCKTVLKRTRLHAPDVHS